MQFTGQRVIPSGVLKTDVQADKVMKLTQFLDVSKWIYFEEKLKAFLTYFAVLAFDHCS